MPSGVCCSAVGAVVGAATATFACSHRAGQRQPAAFSPHADGTIIGRYGVAAASLSPARGRGARLAEATHSGQLRGRSSRRGRRAIAASRPPPTPDRSPAGRPLHGLDLGIRPTSPNKQG